ncbi:hypothetical protein GCM10023178_42050 [Actinomadura luteofluorescens]
MKGSPFGAAKPAAAAGLPEATPGADGICGSRGDDGTDGGAGGRGVGGVGAALVVFVRSSYFSEAPSRRLTVA